MNATPIDRREYPQGTFGALVQAYLSTDVLQKRALSTRDQHRQLIENLQMEYGDNRVDTFRRRHATKVCAKFASTRAEEAQVMRALRALFDHALEMDLIEFNPLRDGFVYFVASDTAIKIGYSADVLARVEQLQQVSSVPLTLLHYEHGTEAREKELHQRFDDFWLRGEWFEQHQTVLTYIKQRQAMCGPRRPL